MFAIALVAIASGAGLLSGSAYYQVLKMTGDAGGSGSALRVTIASTMMTMATMQAVFILLTWWAAGRFGGRRAEVLSLGQPLDQRMLLTGLAGMLAILCPYNLAIYALWPHQFADDLRMFSDLARSEAAWIALLVVTIGAPLSEELIFRGFLLPALAKARADFYLGVVIWIVLAGVLFKALNPTTILAAAGYLGLVILALLVGWAMLAFREYRRKEARLLRMMLASVSTSAMWTGLHFGYSLVGLFEVFLIGLYFAWLMFRFGNLRLTILLHALYNGLQMAVLMSLPVIAGG
jgi:membrane protease YdiL (CAAX protease family)